MGSYFHYDVGGNDALTRLLLHCDGTNGSTSFPDSSVGGHTVTAVGAAAVSTSQSVFGGASAILGAGGNYLSVADSADWTLGANNFTFDFRTRHSSIPSGGSAGTTNTVFFFQEDAAINRYLCGLANDGSVFFVAQTAPATLVASYQSANLNLSINTQYHWAIIRNGANLLISLDGVLQSLSVLTPIGTLPNVGAPLIFGAQNVSLIGPAFMDEIRVSPTTARWTADFAPPVEPYG